MSSSRLPNYLVSHRKRLTLSQDEVAFLLGKHSGAKVCRDEQFARIPSLETALAYEAIYQKPIRELFGGLFQTIEGEVADRAKVLRVKIDNQKADRQTARKRQAIADIITTHSNSLLN